MPTFKFTGSDGRTYSNLGGGPLVVVPGESYDLPECPLDGRWEATEAAPEAPETPAEPEPVAPTPETPQN